MLGRPELAPSELCFELAEPPRNPAGTSTVRSYYESWIREQLPLVRRAQARDYQRQMRRYILPVLGEIALSELRPADIRGFQAELFAKGKSVNTHATSSLARCGQ